MANEKYPNKPLAPWVPKSQRDSGTNLDEGCGDIRTASATAAMGMDKIFNPIGTEFEGAAQTTEINAPGKLSIKELSSVEQISPAGKALAEKTAPRSALT
jgi:hypothetical protein